MAKGGSFERWVCDRLSEWWCGDPDRRIFWRTAGSGAAASVRARKGKRTADHHGDVTAIDPCGAPLTDLLTIEVKRGYNRVSLQDLLDCPPGKKGGNGKGENLPDWIARAQADHEAAGSFSWLLIVRRDGRRPLVIMREDLSRSLDFAAWDAPQGMLCRLTYAAAQVWWPTGERFWAIPLDDFLGIVTPAAIKALAREV